MSILYVMAASAEYGPHLRSRIAPLITGVGPVEAAIAVSGALTTAKTENTLPKLVVSLGSAGSRVLQQCSVYQASNVAYRDMDASALGFAKGETPFLDQPAVQRLPLQLPGIPRATLSTGANVVSGTSYDSIDAEMVDMETFAVLRACQKFGIALIALRGISDGKDELTGITDWTQYLDIIDEKLADAIDLIASEYAAGRLV